MSSFDELPNSDDKQFFRDAMKNFSDDYMRACGEVLKKEWMSATEKEAFNQLVLALRYQTFGAICKYFGKFNSKGKKKKINFPELFYRILKRQMVGESELWVTLFDSLLNGAGIYLDALAESFGVGESSISTLKSELKDQLRSIIRLLREQYTLSTHIPKVKKYREIFKLIHDEFCESKEVGKTARCKKKKKLLLQLTLCLNEIVKAACVKFLENCKLLLTKVLKTFKDLTGSFSQQKNTKCEAEGKIHQVLPETLSETEKSRLNGFSETKNGKVVIYRGLNAIEEPKDNERGLIVPQQDLFREITKMTPIGKTLVSSSPFAIAETVLAVLAFKSRYSRSAGSSFIVRDKKGKATNYIHPRHLQTTIDKIRKCMVDCDDLSKDRVMRCEFKNTLAATNRSHNKKVQPARQQQYSQDAKAFLKLFRTYIKLRKKDVKHDYPCDLTGKKNLAWYYFRWAKYFRLATLGNVNKNVHANSFLSGSQRPEHAIKYACGQKNYCMGSKDTQNGLTIEYNKDKSPKKPIILGVLSVMTVSREYIAKNEKSVVIVPQMISDGKVILPGGTQRIAKEEEVSFYGGLPANDSTVEIVFPIIPLDFSNPEDLSSSIAIPYVQKQSWLDQAKKLAELIQEDSKQIVLQKCMRNLLAVEVGYRLKTWLSENHSCEVLPNQEKNMDNALKQAKKITRTQKTKIRKKYLTKQRQLFIM